MTFTVHYAIMILSSSKLCIPSCWKSTVKNCYIFMTISPVTEMASIFIRLHDSTIVKSSAGLHILVHFERPENDRKTVTTCGALSVRLYQLNNHSRTYKQYLGRFREIVKSYSELRHACLSVCLSSWNNLASTRRILVKFYI